MNRFGAARTDVVSVSRLRIAAAGGVWHKVLQVRLSATEEEVRRSYRALALLHHPDKNCGAEDGTFKLVQAAYKQALRCCKPSPFGKPAKTSIPSAKPAAAKPAAAKAAAQKSQRKNAPKAKQEAKEQETPILKHAVPQARNKHPQLKRARSACGTLTFQRRVHPEEPVAAKRARTADSQPSDKAVGEPCSGLGASLAKQGLSLQSSSDKVSSIDASGKKMQEKEILTPSSNTDSNKLIAREEQPESKFSVPDMVKVASLLHCLTRDRRCDFIKHHLNESQRADLARYMQGKPLNASVASRDTMHSQKAIEEQLLSLVSAWPLKDTTSSMAVKRNTANEKQAEGAKKRTEAAKAAAERQRLREARLHEKLESQFRWSFVRRKDLTTDDMLHGMKQT